MMIEVYAQMDGMPPIFICDGYQFFISNISSKLLTDILIIINKSKGKFNEIFINNINMRTSIFANLCG